jgi:hypothetical protein
MEVVSHDGLIPAYSEDGGGVYMQELSAVDRLIILLWKVGPELV